jgi:hypothetical protein
MEKNEKTEIGASCSAIEFCFSLKIGRSMFKGNKKE